MLDGALGNQIHTAAEAQILELGHGQIWKSGGSAPLLHDPNRRRKKDRCPSGAGSKQGTWSCRSDGGNNAARIAARRIHACTRVRGRRRQSSLPCAGLWRRALAGQCSASRMMRWNRAGAAAGAGVERLTLQRERRCDWGRAGATSGQRRRGETCAEVSAPIVSRRRRGSVGTLGSKEGARKVAVRKG